MIVTMDRPGSYAVLLTDAEQAVVVREVAGLVGAPTVPADLPPAGLLALWLGARLRQVQEDQLDTQQRSRMQKLAALPPERYADATAKLAELDVILDAAVLDNLTAKPKGN